MAIIVWLAALCVLLLWISHLVWFIAFHFSKEVLSLSFQMTFEFNRKLVFSGNEVMNNTTKSGLLGSVCVCVWICYAFHPLSTWAHWKISQRSCRRCFSSLLCLYCYFYEFSQANEKLCAPFVSLSRSTLRNNFLFAVIELSSLKLIEMKIVFPNEVQNNIMKFHSLY